jgi:hypothetical protein
MRLTVALIPSAKGIEQKDHDRPDDIDRPETQPKVNQTSRPECAGRKDVLAWVTSLIHEQEHSQRVDNIQVNYIEKEGNSSKDGHWLWKLILVPLDQR